MIEAWSVEDVRAAEERLGDELRSGELMRRAAEGLAGVVAARLPEGTGEPGRVVGLVGPGNNGGDVLHALARLAADGHDVAAVRTAAAHEGGVDALRRAGGVLLGEDAGPDEVAELIGEADGKAKIVGAGTTREQEKRLREHWRREEDLRAEGYTVVRWTWDDLANPHELRTRLESAFAQARRVAA